MCGLMGVVGHPRSVEIVRIGLHAQQSRGEESAGISFCSSYSDSISDSPCLMRVGGMGLVAEAIPADLPVGYKASIGHVRYSTTGPSCKQNIQPLFTKDNKVALAHNGNLINTPQLREKLQGFISSDSEAILRLYEHNHPKKDFARLGDTMMELEGAYCLLMMNSQHVIAVRDPMGFHPLVLGELDGAMVLASETTAIDAVGGKWLREVRPGEIVQIDIQTGETEMHVYGNSQSVNQCIFELLYFADPASTLFGQNAHLFRYESGKKLAQEHPVDADIVVPVPHSGIDASLGYAEESGIPYGRVFTTNNYAGRSFIMPEQISREQKVASKLHVIHETTQGKRICVVEDSVVRGTTWKAIAALLRKAGASEVHLRVASPPIRCACYYGIDFPDKSKLVATDRTLEEIQHQLKVDSIGYLSLEGLQSCCITPNCYCNACFTGQYPTRIS